MENISTVVIGGGAAGIIAAISAKRSGDGVIICDRLNQLGKKILASGNGRCNLLNDNLSEIYYKQSSQNLIKSILDKFPKKMILAFFNELGLKTISKDGRIFPITNEASSVLKVLELELKQLNIPSELGFTVTNITPQKSGFIVKAKNGKSIACKKVILTTGGKSYPSLGSDGSGYLLAQQLGHNLIEPVPYAVPLVVKDQLCHSLQGQKILAKATSIIEGKASLPISGDLLFTKYGLSGTAILDISEEISIAINRNKKKDVLISLDLIPFLSNQELEKELYLRLRKNILPENFLVGLLPNKLSLALKDLAIKKDINTLIAILKNKSFLVLGTRGWNEAEFTSGGININEVKPYNLESKLIPNLYFAGEILDVAGIRGGYHLAWAWASGWVAGLNH